MRQCTLLSRVDRPWGWRDDSGLRVHPALLQNLALVPGNHIDMLSSQLPVPPAPRDLTPSSILHESVHTAIFTPAHINK